LRVAPRPNLAPAQVGEGEAVRLFVERATAASADFTLDHVNAPVVVDICERLEGLPLAIELAASQVALLSPPAILSLLGHRLDSLVGGPADTPPRHRTLRNAITWSYDLLHRRDQECFRRMSVFSGGCTLEAAAKILQPESRDPLPVLRDLTRLIDHGLLQAQHADSECRFSMLESICEFARERLRAAGDEERVRKLHAEYYLAEATQLTATPVVFGPECETALRRLEPERNNLRAALEWAIAYEPDTAMRLVDALRPFWYIRGLYSEGREWIEAVLRLDGRKSARRDARIC
jgi:predicted ATPase